MYDILVIGAGVTGALITRELSKYKLKVLLLDKENDVGNVTSSANSAIIHSGYDPKPGTLKAKLNVLGCKKYPQLCEELDVSFSKCGTLTVVDDASQWDKFKELVERSKLNGVDIEIFNTSQVKKLEPNITDACLGALFAKDAGIINPFELVSHAVENALDNGCELALNEEVIDIIDNKDHFIVKTLNKEYKTKIVINAAGLYSDKIASMIEPISWNIIPRKGEYVLLDRLNKPLVYRPIFPLPSEKGKGILVAPTTGGNYFLGPSSEAQEDKDDYSTDYLTIENVEKEGTRLVKNIPMNKVIRVFAGLRSTPSTHDFIIEPSKKNNCFINVAGIESPGLASSPAIADYVINNFLKPIINLEEKEVFNPNVRKHIKLKLLSKEERNKLIKENPNYGTIVCNCEGISLGEIEDELSRSGAPTTIKGVKKRTRAGFGRCQGGYCLGLISMALAKKYNLKETEVYYDKIGSNLIIDELKKVK